MNLIMISPVISLDKVTAWSRNLMEGEVLLDNQIKAKVIEVLQFQVLPVSVENMCKVAVLVKLLAPVKPQVGQAPRNEG